MAPGSRTYLCWQDGLSRTGEIKPNNPACSAAVAQSGANSLYNWFSVLRSDAGGRTVGFIPDGKLCSGGNPGFARVRPGPHRLAADPPDRRGRLDFKYSNWAHHPGTFYFYVTKDSWSPTRPLAWSDLEEPFLDGDQPAAARRASAPTTGTTTSAATCRRARAAGTSSTPAGSARTARRTSSAAPTWPSTVATAR